MRGGPDGPGVPINMQLYMFSIFSKTTFGHSTRLMP